MRPKELKTRIFLDGGDPEETRQLVDLLGFLDGQTTNPTLISKNPEVRQRLEKGDTFTEDEILEFYREVVVKISGIIPEGSISVEVYADADTKAPSMLEQGREMFSWIPNAHIKFPSNAEGLKALSEAVQGGMRANMTLCFRQEQAAAVYAASTGAKKGDVYVSPFVGRLDDRGLDGMSLVANILRMYMKGDGHVEVLTASVRHFDHLMAALSLGSDIVTAPFEVLQRWGREGKPRPGEGYAYSPTGLEEIPYVELDLQKKWNSYEISHQLTEKGMKKFSEDWNKLVTGA